MSRRYQGPDGPLDVSARLDPSRPGGVRIDVGDQHWTGVVHRAVDGAWWIELDDGRRVRAVVDRDGDARWVTIGGRTRVVHADHGAASRGQEGGGLEAPMPGRVLQVLVEPGDFVEVGAVLLVVEAMKMEHAIKAPYAGTVVSVAAGAGDMVDAGTPLVVLDRQEADGADEGDGEGGA